MSAALTNWKTTLAGLIFGVVAAVVAVPYTGEDAKGWATRALVAVSAALPGILAKDGIE